MFPQQFSRLPRVARAVVLSISLALLALAPLARGVVAHPATSQTSQTSRASHIGKSGGPAMNLTLHYRSSLAGASNPYRMATDAQGNLYVADDGLDLVRMYDTNDHFVRAFGSGYGTGNGQFNNPGGIVVNGNTVYVVDCDNHRIQEFNQGSGSWIYAFTDSHLTSPTGMALGSNGMLYVTDAGSNYIVEFDTNGIYQGRFGGTGSGPGQFSYPVDIATSPLGVLYVSDSFNKRIQQFKLDGTYVNQWGASSFSGINGITVDRSGMVYVVDWSITSIDKFDPNGSFLGAYAAPHTTPFVPGEFSDPTDVEVRSIPNAPLAVYVSDAGSSAPVQRFDQVTNPRTHTYQAQWGSTGSGNGQFNTPWGVVADSAGNLYVSDNANSRIEKFDQFGNFLLAFGTPGSANGQLMNPRGLAFSPDGNTLYVADSGNNRIEEFTRSGAWVAHYASAVTFLDPEGIAIDATTGSVFVTDAGNNLLDIFANGGLYQCTCGFNHPTGIAVDSARQELFVADWGNNRVQVYDTSGNFNFIGSISTIGTSLSSPVGVATDQRGDVYVVGSGDNHVHQFDVGLINAGVVFGSAGSGNGQFNIPYGITVNPVNGQIYAVDGGNNRIERWGSPWAKLDTIGIYRPSSKTFYLRTQNTTGPANITVPMPYAQTGDLPIVGDWNGDGVDTVGLYRSSTGTFLLQDRNTQESAPDYVFTLGISGDTPISGDWNGDGTSGTGVFRPSNGILYLKNRLSTGYADNNLVLGMPGDKGIAGDWNGDGQDSPGVYRPSNQTFYATNKVTNGVVFSDATAVLGISGDAPFTGDWVAQDSSGIGVFRPSNGITYEKNAIATGYADNFFIYGVAGDIPVAGQWVAQSVPFTVPPHGSQGGRSGSAAPSHPTSVPTRAGAATTTSQPARRTTSIVG